MLLTGKCCDQCSIQIENVSTPQTNYMEASLTGSLLGLQNFSRSLNERGVNEEKAKIKE
jgi:hypothetical protein